MTKQIMQDPHINTWLTTKFQHELSDVFIYDYLCISSFAFTLEDYDMGDGVDFANNIYMFGQSHDNLYSYEEGSIVLGGPNPKAIIDQLDSLWNKMTSEMSNKETEPNEDLTDFEADDEIIYAYDDINCRFKKSAKNWFLNIDYPICLYMETDDILSIQKILKKCGAKAHVKETTR